MCLLRWFIDAFFALSIAPLLSTPNEIALVTSDFRRSAIKRASYIASFAAMHIAMYSASQVEVAMQVYFFELQETAPPATRNRKPLVDLRLFLHPLQSTSENPGGEDVLFPL